MSERHIHRLIWLGLFVEALTALTIVAALFCGIIQIGAWIADRIPMWAIPPMIVSIPAIGLIAIIFDSARTGRRRTIKGYRQTWERRECEER